MTYNITTTTTADEDAELQATCTEMGLTVNELFDFYKTDLLRRNMINRKGKRWEALSESQKDVALTAGEAA